MSKTTKIIIVVVAIIAIAAAVFFFTKKKKTPGSTANPAVDNGDQFADNATWNQQQSGAGNNAYATPPIQSEPSAIDNILSALTFGMYNPNTSSGNSGGNVEGTWVANTFSIPKQTAGTAAATGVLAAGAVTALGQFPLKQGSRGEYVKVVQRAVNQSIDNKKLTGAKLVEDGIWGAKTTAAVKQAYPSGTITYDQFKNISARVATLLGIK